MKLVIVESPTKAKTISRFLGKDYIIKASMGHVMDLPKSKLGVDVDDNFTPQYDVVPDRKKIIAELKREAQRVDTILLATDPDREGEAIASHIQEVLQGTTGITGTTSTTGRQKIKARDTRATRGTRDTYLRIAFHEITEDAIQEALANPHEINKNLVDAQTARRVLDRLVGYKLSPLLWQKVRRGLSAGRVQSVALRLIVEREKEIKSFEKEEYWTMTAVLSKRVFNPEVLDSQARTRRAQTRGEAITFDKLSSGSVKRKEEEGTEFELIEINREKIESQKKFTLYDGEYTVSKTSINNEEQARRIEQNLQTKVFVVADVIKKETKRSPQMPFTTSTLQQEASRRFGYSGKRTMSLAQKLYEEGCITYHRTDSVNMAQKAVFQIREYVKKQFGDTYIPDKPRFYKTKQKLAQEAHECIRPTDVRRPVAEIKAKVGDQYGKLYDLIWRRTVASQMADALVESTTVYVDTKDSYQSSVVSSQQPVNQSSDNQADKLRTDLLESENRKPKTDNRYRFKTNGSVLLFEGFLKVNPYGLQDRKLPKFTVQEQLGLLQVNPVKHETPPPPRYNDASLIGSLEDEGIGRPSTYASIISTIEARNYIERDQGRFVPTPVGIAVNDFLVEHFSNIDDMPFTAQIEDELDAIAQGNKAWVPVIRDFYQPFEKTLEKVKGAQRVKIAVEETDEACPKCGAKLVIRTGKFGKFLSCSNFPTCDFKKAYVHSTNIQCPKCKEGQVIMKKTKKGRTFYGCSRYPNCDFAVWKLKDIEKKK